MGDCTSYSPIDCHSGKREHQKCKSKATGYSHKIGHYHIHSPLQAHGLNSHGKARFQRPWFVKPVHDLPRQKVKIELILSSLTHTLPRKTFSTLVYPSQVFMLHQFPDHVSIHNHPIRHNHSHIPCLLLYVHSFFIHVHITSRHLPSTFHQAI